MYRSVYHHRSHHVSEERGLETVEHQPNPIALQNDEVRRIIIDTLAELSHFFLLFFFPLFLFSFHFSETLTNLTSLAFRYEAVVGADSSRFPRIIDVACTRARVGGRQGADRGKARSRFRSTHVARKGRIYHTRGLVIMAIVIIIIIIIIIIVIIPKGVIRYRDS